MIASTTPIAVIPDRATPGVSDWSDEMVFAEVLPLGEALQRAWQTDAHMMAYRIDGEERWPRCNRVFVPEVRRVGADLSVTCCVQDYDNPGHAAWTPQLRAEFEQRLEAAAATGFSYATNWTARYYTAHGARFIWVYDEPVSLEEAERRHRGMIRLWAKHGIEFDAACSGWNHLFRLPFAARDGERPTKEQVDLRINHDALIEASDLPLVGEEMRINSAYVHDDLESSKPSPEEAFDRMWERRMDRAPVMTEFHRAAKKRLQNRACWPCIFDHRPIASPGARDQTIWRYVGQATSLCYNLPDAAPEAIYAMFLPAVEQLEPDNDTVDWTETLWNACRKCWLGERGKEQLAAEQEKQRQVDGVEKRSTMLEGVMAWTDPPDEVTASTESGEKWLSSHLIAICPHGMHLMMLDGSFDSVAIKNPDHLPVRIRELGLDNVIPLTHTTEKGDVRKVSSLDMIHRHGFHVPGGLHGRATNAPNQIINYGTDKAALSLALYRRRDDLEPRYSPEVDAWLKRMFRTEDYHTVCQWISWALAIEEGPIAALSVAGPPGAGKKLLAVGLAECWDCGAYATGRVFGRFNEELMRSPLVVVDEGLRSFGGNTGALDTSDQFRSLISGDPISIEPKGRPAITINVPVRMLFTANNEHILAALAGSKDLSPEDRSALGQRLIHVNAQPAATDWLAMQGGLAHTGRHGHRWIRGDAGNPSDFVIARHFLWLYTNRRQPHGTRGGRFLMAGDPSANRRIFDSAGSTPVVTQAVIELIEAPIGKRGVCVDVEKGTVYITTEAVVQHLLKNYPPNRHRDHRQCANALKHLMLREVDSKVTLVDGQQRRLRARWKELEAAQLLAFAEEHGLESQKLQDIVNARSKAANKQA